MWVMFRKLENKLCELHYYWFTLTNCAFTSLNSKFSVVSPLHSLTHTLGLSRWLLPDMRQGILLAMKRCCPIRALIKIRTCMMSLSERRRAAWGVRSNRGVGIPKTTHQIYSAPTELLLCCWFFFDYQTVFQRNAGRGFSLNFHFPLCLQPLFLLRSSHGNMRWPQICPKYFKVEPLPCRNTEWTVYCHVIYWQAIKKLWFLSFILVYFLKNERFC